MYYEYGEWEYRPVYGTYTRFVYKVYSKERIDFVGIETMSKERSYEMMMRG